MHAVDASKLKGVNLYLVGMMASGKSTVGRQLARRLGYRFFDTDDLIERSTKLRIPEIFAQQGEVAFRELETQVLADLSPYQRLVVATGGGVVLRPQNWSYLHHGVVIWLDVTAEVLLKRLRQSDPEQRPLLRTLDLEGTLLQLMEQRRPFYAEADVHVRVDVPVPSGTVTDWVWEQVQRRLRPEGDTL